jgi:hypothetical protein
MAGLRKFSGGKAVLGRHGAVCPLSTRSNAPDECALNGRGALYRNEHFYIMSVGFRAYVDEAQIETAARSEGDACSSSSG